MKYNIEDEIGTHFLEKVVEEVRKLFKEIKMI